MKEEVLEIGSFLRSVKVKARLEELERRLNNLDKNRLYTMMHLVLFFTTVSITFIIFIYIHKNLAMIMKRKNIHVKHKTFSNQRQGLLLRNEVFAGEGFLL